MMLKKILVYILIVFLSICTLRYIINYDDTDKRRISFAEIVDFIGDIDYDKFDIPHNFSADWGILDFLRKILNEILNVLWFGAKFVMYIINFLYKIFYLVFLA